MTTHIDAKRDPGPHCDHCGRYVEPVHLPASDVTIWQHWDNRRRQCDTHGPALARVHGTMYVLP